MAAENPSAGTLGTIGAALLSLFAVALGLWARHRKETGDNSASLEGIRNEGVMALIADYRQQVVSLKADMLAQATRQVEERRSYEARYDVLEAKHEALLMEFSMVRAELDTLRSRMDVS